MENQMEGNIENETEHLGPFKEGVETYGDAPEGLCRDNVRIYKDFGGNGKGNERICGLYRGH